MDREYLRVRPITSEAERKRYKQDIVHGKTLFPLTCGGMGVGVSNVDLAIALAREGCGATLSGSAAGFNSRRAEILAEKNPEKRKQLLHEANMQEMIRQIRSVRQAIPEALLGMNVLVAMSDFLPLVDAACREGIDILYVAAGPNRDVSKVMTRHHDTLFVPIIGSRKEANFWWNRASHDGEYRRPDLFYFEHPFAGGHIAQKVNETIADYPRLYDPETVRRSIREVAEKIPVIYGGNVFGIEEIERALHHGFQGVILGTRFKVTNESGATNAGLLAHDLNDDLDVTVAPTSPTGLMSRYIGNAPSDVVAGNADRVREACVSCIGNFCQFRRSGSEKEYCIARHLPLVVLEESEKTEDERCMETGPHFVGATISKIRADRRNNETSIYKDATGKTRIPDAGEVVDDIFRRRDQALPQW